MLGGTDERPSFSLVWREKIPPREPRGNLKRFGSIALERVVPASLNGTATLQIEGERLEYSLVVPEGNFETD